MRTRLAAAGLFFAIVIFVVARPRGQAPAPGAAAPAPAGDTISFRVTLGYLRLAAGSYDGTVDVSGGQLRKLEGWRFFQQDAVTAPNSWKLDIKRVVFENQPDKPNPVAAAQSAQNLVPAGVLLTVDSSASSAAFRTRRGDFTVPLRELAYGKVLRYLDGDVLVERIPATRRISPDGSEQHDYPSLARTRSGAVWTAWQAYEDRGDHVYARADNGGPVRLTTTKADIYRTAVGEDSRGGVHVVWSQRDGTDWNLLERVLAGSNWGAVRTIVSGQSPNIFHKLAGDHLVWVGNDGGKSYLYTASFDGSAWSAPQQIGGPSVWSPDAAADRQGNLYVAWDSYQNGNYDIFFRRISAAARFRSSRTGDQVARAFRRTLHLPSMRRAGPGSRGTNRASIGARTGTTRTRTAPPCCTPTAPSAWR